MLNRSVDPALPIPCTEECVFGFCLTFRIVHQSSVDCVIIITAVENSHQANAGSEAHGVWHPSDFGEYATSPSNRKIMPCLWQLNQLLLYNDCAVWSQALTQYFTAYPRPFHRERQAHKNAVRCVWLLLACMVGIWTSVVHSTVWRVRTVHNNDMAE